jgi:hypothetical protein
MACLNDKNTAIMVKLDMFIRIIGQEDEIEID